MGDLSDEAVAHIDARPEWVKEELQRKLRTYINDQIREGMSEGAAGTQAMATWGTQRGTAAGEIARTIMQFKAYTLNFMARSMKRELMRMGPGNVTGDMRGFLQGVRQGADVPGLAWLIATTTTLGYFAMTLKELAKGASHARRTIRQTIPSWSWQRRRRVAEQEFSGTSCSVMPTVWAAECCPQQQDRPWAT
ncbi:hypothetical protein [Komagataeibacter kakiaceti]|uniref:hypothetical protein n=1 Tax=Komagataeibacter kakiaceti TaxID=943261 RepID=UPI00046FCDD5|nr:hypothetical protein [Komagataeibacter kakiaceti]